MPGYSRPLPRGMGPAPSGAECRRGAASAGGRGGGRTAICFSYRRRGQGSGRGKGRRGFPAPGPRPPPPPTLRPSRLLTHFCTFPAEIKLLPESLRAAALPPGRREGGQFFPGRGQALPLAGRAGHRADFGAPLTCAALRVRAAEGWGQKWFASTELRKSKEV